jgi:2-polyprenyl-3-methyl-5-hydroxy-6-metoxy-1,4-benzoquinol methylase
MDTMKSDLKPSFPTCSLCNKKSEKVVFGNILQVNKRYSVYECSSCKVWITHPIPSLKELSILYSTGNYRSKTGKRFNPVLEKIIHSLTIRKRNRINNYISSGRILDIGCGRGLFLNIMRSDGWSVMGYEFDEKSASHAINNYGIDVHTGVMDNQFEDESFDVVNVNHVLEHLKNPEQTLENCHRILKKNGLLVIAVPNIDSFQAKFGKDKWFQLDIPCHLYHFSSKSLNNLIEKKNFHIQATRHFKFEYNPFGWLQTILNVSGVRENHFYDLLKSSELRKTRSGILSLTEYLKLIFLIPLSIPVSVILSLIEAAYKKGGTIEVYAIKK